jgi:hypothetical protein
MINVSSARSHTAHTCTDDYIAHTGNDYNAFISAVHTFFQMSGPGKCSKPVRASHAHRTT